MAHTKSHSTAHPTAHVAHGSDMAAAFAGLVIGTIALLLLIGSIVMLTNRHYAAERPPAAAER
jgi:hypothetical protein